ncbi:hypothetical protein FACS1894216_21270 [Synergistales bacterium]|nr:hypothetical protein FACS1894216_21270 [Synergistales bacterium]
MADTNSRTTEYMPQEGNRTQIMEKSAVSERTTQLMNTDSGRTAHMSDSHRAARSTFSDSLSVGSVLGEIRITGIIAEHTGEARIFLIEYKEVQYVMKLYHVGKQPKQELLQSIASANSPYLIRSNGSGFFDGRFYEYLPYYADGDLLAKQSVYSEEQLEKTVVPCVIEGLKALHEHNIVHRDIKPSNMFLDKATGNVIIADFGISSALDSGVTVRATTMSRTLGYSAPETASGFISKESDYYSLGITLLHLVTGQDPFVGMTDMEILYQTINKKVPIPQSLSKRFGTLIQGLTLKERSDRRGYNEVKRWLNHEEVAIIDKNKKIPGIKPYQFSKHDYYSLEDLSQVFCMDWENAKKHLYRGFVERNVEQYGQELASQCIDLKEISDKDVAVFRLIYLLNPRAPLCYKGRIFNDLEHVGSVMANALPDFDTDILEMLTNDCFEYYLKLDNSYEQTLVDHVVEIVSKIKAGNKDYYYALMYFLCPQIGYQYHAVTFDTLEALVKSLDSLTDTALQECAKTLTDDPRFYMWVYSLGYGQQVTEWLDVYEKAVW